jgi:hypothetical protein
MSPLSLAKIKRAAAGSAYVVDRYRSVLSVVIYYTCNPLPRVVISSAQGS